MLHNKGRKLSGDIFGAVRYKVVRVHALMTYGVLEAWLHALLTSELDINRQ